MKTRFLFVLGVQITCLFAVISAQPSSTSSHGPQQFSAMRAEMLSWAQKEVVPSLREWKGVLDRSLSTTDLEMLNRLRDSARLLRNERMRLIKEWSVNPTTETEQKAERRAKMRAIGEQERALAQELKPIAERSRETLRAIGETAKPKIELWRATVVSKVEEVAAAKGLNVDTDHKYWMMRYLPLMGLDAQMTRRFLIARFMLWDGGDIPELELTPAMIDVPSLNKINTNLMFSLSQNVPNPVSGSRTTVTFALEQNDHVKMTLLDAKGSELSVITDAEYTAGSHYVEIPTDKLANGSYVYRLVCSQGTLSNTLIVLH